jgi:predicted helicase
MGARAGLFDLSPFEHVCRWFLNTDPRFVALLKQVWLWDDWPGRWGPDCGIDLVARDVADRVWAIQSKCYATRNSVTKHDVDAFLSETSRPEIDVRLLIQTTDRMATNAERVIRAQDKPIHVVRFQDLQNAPIVWPQHIDDFTTGMPVKPHSPRHHQQNAIGDVLRGLQTSNRGQLLMACGTGKTLTALWITEQLNADLTLVLLPSLALLSQTVTAWLANRRRDFAYLPVCSDKTVAKGVDAAVLFRSDLPFPVTTEPSEIALFLRQDGRDPRQLRLGAVGEGYVISYVGRSF